MVKIKKIIQKNKSINFIIFTGIIFIIIGIYLFIFPSTDEIIYSESISFDLDNNSIQDLNLFFKYSSENDFIVGEKINIKVEIHRTFDGDDSLFELLKNNKDINLIFSFPDSNYYYEETKYVKGVKINPGIFNLKYNYDTEIIEGYTTIYYNTPGFYSPDIYLNVFNKTIWTNLEKIRIQVNSNNSEKSFLINQKIFALTFIIIGLTILNFNRRKK